MLTKLIITIAFFEGFLNSGNCFDVRSFSVYEDALLDVPDLIRKYGYPCEVYDVVTKDGYYVQLHRIPHGKENFTTGNIPVIVHHGLLASSAAFVILGPGKALAYLLADAGYDVWLLNNRGNRYSRKHTILDPDWDTNYWRYSFHEIGIYDLPAAIDFILNATNSEKLFHVGHSQGTTTFYVMASERPEYNDKIIAQFSYAPSAYVGHLSNPYLLEISKYLVPLQITSRLLGIYEFFPGYRIINVLGSLICANEINKDICTDLIISIYGHTRKAVDAAMLTTYIGHVPAGASVEQLLHYGQEIHSGRFCQYDFGPIVNVAIYNSTIPPSYDVTKITAPLYLFYSKVDDITVFEDTEKLRNQLVNVIDTVVIDDPEWLHDDFILSTEARYEVYEKTIEFMDEHVV